MQDLDAPEMIADFGGTYSVTRRAAATYSAGIAVAGATSTVSVLACFWPASGRDLQRLPEGRRSQETRAGVCDTALLVGGEGSANEADLVTVDGVAWEVQSSSPWPNDPSFNSVIIQRPNVP
jgi:hypothetical protein